MNDLPPNHPLAAYSQREQARAISAPTGFAERVALRIASDIQRTQRRRRFARFGGMALAASALLALGIALPRAFREAGQPMPVEVAAVPPTKLGEQWSEAGRSLESLTAHAVQPITEPAGQLFATADGFQLPTANLDSVHLPEFEFSEIALAGLEPVADQPCRAFQTMLGDFGFGPTRK